MNKQFSDEFLHTNIFRSKFQWFFVHGHLYHWNNVCINPWMHSIRSFCQISQESNYVINLFLAKNSLYLICQVVRTFRLFSWATDIFSRLILRAIAVQLLTNGWKLSPQKMIVGHKTIETSEQSGKSSKRRKKKAMIHYHIKWRQLNNWYRFKRKLEVVSRQVQN